MPTAEDILKRNEEILQKVMVTREPFVVFRAQDCLIGVLLNFYADQASDAGAEPEYVEFVQEERERILAWQDANADRVKVPDLGPKGR